MEANFDYKIIKGPTDHCQKVLNQWKHKYGISILKMTVLGDALVVLVFRRPLCETMRKP